MTKAVQEARPSTVSVDLCGSVSDVSSSMTEPCTGLLSALSELATREHALDAEQLESASPADLAAVLDAVWESRRYCDLLALAVQKTQPETSGEEVVRRNALLAYSALANPDHTARASLSQAAHGTPFDLYLTAMSQNVGAPCCHG